MTTIARSVILMTLLAALAPHFAAAQTADATNPSPMIGPNAAEPGAASPTVTAPPPTTPVEPTAPAVTEPAPAVNEPAPATVSNEPSGDEDRPSRHRLMFGVDYTMYLPTDRHTRDRFGSSWSSLGLGIGGVGQSGKKSRLAPEFNLVIQTKGDNHVVMAPIGLTYRVHSGTMAAAQPYTGASLGLLVVDLRSKEDDISSGTSAGGYGSVYAGVSFKDSYFVEARYYAASKVRSFDLSGASLSAGIRF
ncbi:MAG: hypothetical protein ABIY70_08115 [Capsulimonas sp.]|uniref:hypothetical protein n=1 Tax=Capsulimonas sp. TaxID=2494211 RepID=UPI0032646925